MFKRFFLLFLCCAVFTGCAAQPTSPNTYRATEALRTSSAEAVTVVRVRPVAIVDRDGIMSAQSGVPGVLGAVVGAVLGARIIGDFEDVPARRFDRIDGQGRCFCSVEHGWYQFATEPPRGRLRAGRMKGMGLRTGGC